MTSTMSSRPARPSDLPEVASSRRSSTASADSVGSTDTTSTTSTRTSEFPAPRDLDEADVLKYMIHFITKDEEGKKLRRIYNDHPDNLGTRLGDIPKNAAKLPTSIRGGLSSELALELALVSLYDLVVLVDNSTSMGFLQNGKRIAAVKKLIKTAMDLYLAVTGNSRGIHAVRFLNSNVGEKGTPEESLANNIIDPNNIDKLVKAAQFNGLTMLGTGLKKKILEPFVYNHSKRVKKGTGRKIGAELKRPLLVMVITDGTVEGENQSVLTDAITELVDDLKKSRFKASKVVGLQFLRVGDDAEAAQFLEELDNREGIRDTVDVQSTKDIGKIFSMDQATTVYEKMNLIKLLMGPIRKTYDELEKPKDEEEEPLEDGEEESEVEVEGDDDDDDDAGAGDDDGELA